MIKKIALFLSLGLLFAISAVSVVVVLWDRDVKGMLVPKASEYPVDWKQQIRAFSDLPAEMSRFAADTVVEGDATGPLRAMVGVDSWDAYEDTYRALAAGSQLSARDSSVLRSSLTDSVLTAVIAAANMTEYSGLAAESANGITVLSIAVPDYSHYRGIALGLLTRAAAHLDADSQPAALGDIAAVMRLGSLVYQRSVLLGGNLAGREMIALGADQLGRYAAAVADTSLAAAASVLGAWARRHRNPGPLVAALGSDAEAALELARDTDVLTCWRVAAIWRFVSLNLRPGNIPFGISGSVGETMAGLENIADPGVAWTARAAANTIAGFNELSIGQRIGLLRGAGVVF